MRRGFAIAWLVALQLCALPTFAQGLQYHPGKTTNGEIDFALRLESGPDASHLSLLFETTAELNPTRSGFAVSFHDGLDPSSVLFLVYNVRLQTGTAAFRASLIDWPGLERRLPPEMAARFDATVLDQSSWVGEFEHHGHLHRVTMRPIIKGLAGFESKN